MGRYVGVRFLTGLGTLFVVTVIVFLAMRLVPGTYADFVLPIDATPAQRAELNKAYGLDEPVPVQYAKWISHLVQGDFGQSLTSTQSVTQLFKRRIPVTLELAILAMLMTMLIGLPLALAAGMARRKFSREGGRLAGALALSTPTFVIGSVFLYLFSRYSLWLQIGDYVPFRQDPVQNLRTILLPAITLSIFGIALVVRIGRDAVAGVLSEPYVTAARARGESTRHIVRHHVLRNATIPILTVLAIFAGELMGGAVIVETLFNLPGLGRAAVQGIQTRDYPVIQGIVVIAAACFIGINMLADFSYGVIDPRVRRTGRTE